MMTHYIDPDRQGNFAAVDRLLHYMAVPPLMNGRYKLVHHFMVSILATVV